jgi:hypothetical protein
LRGRLFEYYQQAGNSLFLKCLIGFLLVFCTNPGEIARKLNVDMRAWLLELLGGIENSCVHSLNCDALAWRIN